jgi:hypothetical protein
MEALNILEVATKARQHNNLDERPAYFNELKAMRENWRIRKINDFVFGDLGYRICKSIMYITSNIIVLIFRWAKICTRRAF